ncbi:MAG TPA: magnesium transporter [Polyangiaceae bacterium]|jgi:magnesium transporter|nr:magnesium transporter [Polyangiaceae bacterium]
MRFANLIGPELHQLLKEDPDQVRELLEEIHDEDLADLIAELPDDEAAEILARLPTEEAAPIFERLDDERQAAIVTELGPESIAQIAVEMSSDERADLIKELPEDVGGQVLANLEQIDPLVAEDVEALAQWPEHSAGSLMTTDYISVTSMMSISEVIHIIRTKGAEAETIYYVYALSQGKRLDGIASARDLLLADPQQKLAEILTSNVVTVPPEMDQEEVAKRLAKYDLAAIPVVDDKGILRGVITVDDVIDVLTQEQTEDVQKIGGVEPLDASYFQTTFWTFIRKRATWLIILFVEEFFTGTAMRHYDEVLSAVSKLSYYVPLLLSAGGNSGSQSSSLIIRGLAVGEVKPADWWRIVGRELGQGVILGIFLASVGMARALMWGDGMRFAVVVGVTLVGIVVMGCVVGSMLPLALRRVGFDPATSSTPFIASLVDVIGIIIYFNIAKVVLAEVIGSAVKHP